jgi:hypothetical protein
LVCAIDTTARPPAFYASPRTAPTFRSKKAFAASTKKARDPLFAVQHCGYIGVRKHNDLPAAKNRLKKSPMLSKSKRANVFGEERQAAHLAPHRPKLHLTFFQFEDSLHKKAFVQLTLGDKAQNKPFFPLK